MGHVGAHSCKRTKPRAHDPPRGDTGSCCPQLFTFSHPPSVGPCGPRASAQGCPRWRGAGGCWMSLLQVPHQPPQRSFFLRRFTRYRQRAYNTEGLKVRPFSVTRDSNQIQTSFGQKGDSLVLGACISRGPGETHLSHGWIQGLIKQCHSPLLSSSRLSLQGCVTFFFLLQMGCAQRSHK